MEFGDDPLPRCELFLDDSVVLVKSAVTFARDMSMYLLLLPSYCLITNK